MASARPARRSSRAPAQRHPPRRLPHRTRQRARGRRDPVGTPYYNRPNRRGLAVTTRMWRGRPRSPSCSTTSLAAQATTTQRPARRARPDRGHRRRQAGESAELAPIDGLELYAGNDNTFARTLDIGGAGVISWRATRRRTRCAGWSTSRAPRGDRRLAARCLRGAVRDHQPTCTKAALNLLGHDVGGLRLPLVEATEERRGAGHARAPRPRSPRALPREPPARPAARRAGRDRQEHDGRRARRPHHRRRCRPALSHARDGGHRPRATRLQLPARARRGHRGDRHHPRSRGSPGRAALGPARARRAPARAGLRGPR